MAEQFSRKLRCVLTREERLERGQQFADAHVDVEQEEEQQAQVKASLKASLAAKVAVRSELAQIVSTGAEFRMVACVEDFDFGTGLVNTIRTDTGEVIDRRKMTDDERQIRLPEADPEPEPPVKPPTKKTTH